MSQYYGGQPANNAGYGAPSSQNLQFYPSSYSPGVGGGGAQQGGYGYSSGQPSGGGYGSSPGFNSGFGASPRVSGRMGEQGGLRTGWLAAFSTEGYDNEPPLLEELGVHFGHIQAKTLAVLNPFRRIDQHVMDDADLAGPILFFLFYGFSLLFSGKLHFGLIYGLALMGSVSLQTIFSLMSTSESHAGDGPAAAYAASAPGYPDQSGGVGPGATAFGSSSASAGHPSTSTLTFPRSASVLGYCMLPLVATSLLGIVMPMDTPLGIVITAVAVVWCMYSASGMFCAVGRMRSVRKLVAYPLALFYISFGILGVFSSRAKHAAGAA